MTNGTINAETPAQKLAQEARQNDMKAANEGARTAAQTSVLINGGAATAILAFLSTYLSKEPTVPASIPVAAACSLLGYAVGVCSGAWSMWCASQACGQFGLGWEAVLHGHNDDALTFRNAGNGWLQRHRGSFALSILLFLASSGAMAYGFFASVK